MKNNAVYELIKSLNMSEKRQFKIYSSRHIIEGENKYILLFNLLEKMEIFDEGILKAGLEQHNKKNTYIKTDMHYLYLLILKSLVLFHAGKSAQLILNESISIIEILFYKGNYIQCIKEIYKAAAIARDVELYPSLLKILEFEKLVYNHLNEQKRSEASIINEMTEINKKQEIIIEYTQLYNQANLARIQISKTRNVKEIKVFEKIMKHPLLQQKNKPKFIDASIKYSRIHAMWCYVNQHKKEELAFNKKIIQMYDTNPLYKEEHLIEYVNTYSRIISISKDLDEVTFYKELNSIRSITVSSDKLYFMSVSSQVFNFSYMIQLSMYLQKKQFEKVMIIIPDIESGLKKYKNILIPSYKITFLYMLAYYYFAVGNFDDARKKINTLLNEYSEAERPDLYNFAKLMNLLIHFELGNHGYIRYKQASVRYYYKKQSADFETENHVLKFFSKEKNYTTYLQNSLLSLKATLQNTKTHSLEKYAYNYFDFLDWINSKILKKSSMSELYK